MAACAERMTERRNWEPTGAPVAAAECTPAAATRFAYGTDRIGYGTTELTEVPQFALLSLVPPQVGRVSVNAAPVQFGNWM